jgi:hypothetical protein
MPFEYSCFISYHRGQHKLAKKMIEDLYEALSNEIELYMRDKKIFLDKDLECGDLYNEKLAKSLCRSACMIMVFTPAYFDKKHTYCAKEFKAMEKLERKRLKLLKNEGLRESGLIIPIIFRGGDYLPSDIREYRNCYYFDSYMLFSGDISTHPEYAPKIKIIADKIFRLCKKFEDLPAAFDDCDRFKLPSDEEIEKWLNGIQKTKIPFPGGS